MSHGDSALSALRDVIAHADAIAMGADPDVGPAHTRQQSALPLMLQGVHGQQADTHERQAHTHERQAHTHERQAHTHVQQALAARHQLAFQDEAQAEAFFDHAVRALQCGSPAVDSQIEALERDLLSRSNTLSAEQLRQGSKAHALAEQCAALEARLEEQLRSQPPEPASACGEPGGLAHSLGASAPPWRREKAALHQQVAELQAQLAALTLTLSLTLTLTITLTITLTLTLTVTVTLTLLQAQLAALTLTLTLTITLTLTLALSSHISLSAHSWWCSSLRVAPSSRCTAPTPSRAWPGLGLGLG